MRRSIFRAEMDDRQSSLLLDPYLVHFILAHEGSFDSCKRFVLGKVSHVVASVAEPTLVMVDEMRS